MWYVYILPCEDNAYYTGVTNNIIRRMSEHLKKTSHYTGYNPPRKIVYQEIFDNKLEAEQREAQVKRWSHAKKSALIRGDQTALKQLSVSRD